MMNSKLFMVTLFMYADNLDVNESWEFVSMQVKRIC